MNKYKLLIICVLISIVVGQAPAPTNKTETPEPTTAPVDKPPTPPPPSPDTTNTSNNATNNKRTVTAVLDGDCCQADPCNDKPKCPVKVESPCCKVEPCNNVPKCTVQSYRSNQPHMQTCCNAGDPCNPGQKRCPAEAGQHVSPLGRRPNEVSCCSKPTCPPSVPKCPAKQAVPQPKSISIQTPCGCLHLKVCPCRAEYVSPELVDNCPCLKQPNCPCAGSSTFTVKDQPMSPPTQGGCCKAEPCAPKVPKCQATLTQTKTTFMRDQNCNCIKLVETKQIPISQCPCAAAKKKKKVVKKQPKQKFVTQKQTSYVRDQNCNCYKLVVTKQIPVSQCPCAAKKKSSSKKKKVSSKKKKKSTKKKIIKQKIKAKAKQLIAKKKAKKMKKRLKKKKVHKPKKSKVTKKKAVKKMVKKLKKKKKKTSRKSSKKSSKKSSGRKTITYLDSNCKCRQLVEAKEVKPSKCPCLKPKKTVVKKTVCCKVQPCGAKPLCSSSVAFVKGTNIVQSDVVSDVVTIPSLN